MCDVNNIRNFVSPTDIYFKLAGIEYDDDTGYVACSYHSVVKRDIVVRPDKAMSRYDVSKGDLLLFKLKNV